jgi:membrane-bound lytic murein transglycosylase B
MKIKWKKILHEPARAWHKYALAAVMAGAFAGGMALQQGFNYEPTVASVRGSSTTTSVMGDTAKLTRQQRFFLPVAEQLLAQGADAGYVRQLLNDSSLAFYEKLTKISIPVRPPEPKPLTVKPRTSPYDYAHNDVAVLKSSAFIALNDSVLCCAARTYSVPKEAITAIMWVETRFGDFLGDHHVPSVYLSYAMATQPECLQKNKDRLKADFTLYHEKLFKEKVAKSKELTQQDTAEVLDKWAAIEEKMLEKAQKKATWAIGELLALQTMRKVSPVPISQLRGSWAGAFGLSQFLPSSYMKLAVDGNSDGKINLFDVHDAAHSIGHYLSSAGWGGNKKSQHRAVYHYNHSEEYVAAVLGLTKRLSTVKTVSVNRAAEKE